MSDELDRLRRRAERAEAENKRLSSRWSFDTAENANIRALTAEARLRALDYERIEREEQQRKAVAEANERSQAAARDAALQKEIEETRKASWLRWHTLDGANVARFAANGFSPTRLKDNTPDDPNKWPPDDGVAESPVH